MKILLILLGVILLIYVIAVAYFYRFAFVRLKKEDTDNLEAATNKVLEPYFDIIKPGFKFIENQPHSWVETNSFDGLRLAARYYPCGNSNRTMLLFHGYRSTAKRDFSCAVKMYRDMGLNVLLCDQRSHGRSEGKLITFGVKERFDVVSWIEYILSAYGEDTEIFLGGMSMGATTVLLASGLDLPENVKGIVADCGFTSPEDIIGKVARQSFHISSKVFFWVFDILSRIFGKFSLYNVSTVDALKRNNIPVMLIHGKKDGFVPVEMSERGYAAAVADKELMIVEEANHGFSYLVDPVGVTERVGNFIARL